MINNRLIPASVLVLSALSLPALAADPRPSVFTSAQARKGKVAYESTCGICHLESLRGRIGMADELPDVDTLPRNYRETIESNAGQVPPLVGEEFLAKWGKKSAGELTARIANAIQGFPPTNTNDNTFIELTAYILQANGASPGQSELTANTAVPVSATVAMAKPPTP